MGSISAFQKKILQWHRAEGRHDLPWRKTKNPYHILVSEIMLQQTQVDRVIQKYAQFLKKFPTPEALAKASLPAVLKEWRGLGYNRRALFLKRAAETIVNAHQGTFPRGLSDIESLPGVGKYTARAISVFAFDAPELLIETNIRRVFLHHFFPNKKNVSDADIVPLLEKTLWKKSPRVWFSALMDYGALALKEIENPNKRSAHYAKQSPFEGSTRYARSQILQRILYKECASLKELLAFFHTEPHMKHHCTEKKMLALLNAMAKEGLLYERNGLWRVSPL